MIRSAGFKRAPARPARQWEGDQLPGPRAPAERVVSGDARMVVQLPKRAYVRSKKVMKAFRLIPCQRCSKDDGTVCGAHSNWAIHGKGRGIKADDNRCASLCSACHEEIDSGLHLSDTARQLQWWSAHVLSVLTLQHLGLWPADVPVPAFDVYPWTASAPA